MKSYKRVVILEIISLSWGNVPLAGDMTRGKRGVTKINNDTIT